MTSEIFVSVNRAKNTNNCRQEIIYWTFPVTQGACYCLISSLSRYIYTHIFAWRAVEVNIKRRIRIFASLLTVHGLCFSKVRPNAGVPRAPSTERFPTRSLHRQDAAWCSEDKTREAWSLPRWTVKRRYVDSGALHYRDFLYFKKVNVS